MLGYAEYLAIKRLNPEQDVYIETIIYDIPDAEKTIKQWNGYELERIFNIHAPNIKDHFSTEEWNEILNEVKDSEFWLHDWNYPAAIGNALSKHLRCHLEIVCKSNYKDKDERILIRRMMTKFFNTGLGYNFRRKLLCFNQEKRKGIFSHPERIFIRSDADLYCGFTLLLKFSNNNIELIEEEIRETFVFPKLNEENIVIAKEISNSESIAIHIRRGDMLNDCNKYYTGGYFKRAVAFIKKHVANPTFFVFSDPGSEDWAKANLSLIGLNKEDSYRIITWNSGFSSYRDMQLISKCKHAIITVSSFGWWGAYLIKKPSKITISPELEINTTHHC